MLGEPERCPNRAPKDRTPDGWTVAQLASQPRWKYALEPGARCELPAGHDGAHRSGGLLWHDPPLIVIV